MVLGKIIIVISCGLTRFSSDSHQILTRVSPESHQSLTRFSPESYQILTRFSPDSHQNLTRFSPDFCLILRIWRSGDFGSGEFLILAPSIGSKISLILFNKYFLISSNISFIFLQQKSTPE